MTARQGRIALTVLLAFVGYLVARVWTSALRANEERRLSARETDRVQGNVEYLREVGPRIAAAADNAIDRIFDMSLSDDDDRQGSGRRDGSAHFEADQEWLNMPRSRFDVAGYLCGPPVKIEGRMLFRHAVLNPRDAFIPASQRAEFDIAIGKLKLQILEAAKTETEVGAAEFSALLAAGRARSRSVASIEANLSSDERREVSRMRDRLAKLRAKSQPERTLEELKASSSVVVPSLFFKEGEPYVVKNTNGVVYSTRIVELPTAMKVAEFRTYLLMELSAHIVAWFGENVGLSSSEQARIVTRVQAMVDARLR